MVKSWVKIAALVLLVWLVEITVISFFEYPWALVIQVLFFLLALYQIEWALLTFIFLIPFQPKIQVYFTNPNIFFLEGLFFPLVLIWFIRSRIRQKEDVISSNPLYFPLILFCTIILLSSLLAINNNNYFSSVIFWQRLGRFFQGELTRFYPLRVALIMVEGILLFLLLNHIITSTHSIKKLLIAILASSSLVAVYGFYQYFYKEFALSWRLNSTLADVNSFGSYLVLLSFLPISALFWAPRWLKLILAINASLMLTCIILTGSKISMVAFLLSTIVTGFVLIEQKIKPFKIKLSLIVGIILSFSIFLILVNNQSPRLAGKNRPYLEFFVNAFDYSYVENYLRNYRGHQWKAAIEMIKDYPVLGIGLSEYYFKLKKYRDPHARGYNPVRENAHNYFLQLGAETGLLGFAIFTWILWIVLKYQRLVLRYSQNTHWKGYIVGLGSGLIGYLITWVTGHPLLLIEQQWIFWTIIGLIFCIGRVIAVPHIQSKNTLMHTKILFLVIFSLFCYYWIQGNIHKDLREYSYGFYDWEESAELGRFRWTGMKAKTLLKIAGKVINIPLADGGHGLAKESPRVHLYLENKLLDTIIVNTKNWQVFQYYLPINIAPGRNRVMLSIQLEKTWIPAELGLNKDERTLGVTVGQISWSEELSRGEAGFYHWEQEIGTAKSFRWTRKQASSYLSVATPKLRFDIKTAHPNISRSPQQVKFYFNEQLLKIISLNNYLWTPVTINFPPRARDGILTLQSNRTWNPYRTKNSSDDRDLGIMITPFSFIP